MKFLLIILSLSFSLMGADATKAAESLGVYNNYDVALKEAQSANKLMVFVVVWDPCKACDKLVKETLFKKEVQDKLKKSVTLILDYKAKMPQEFRIEMAPKIYYVDPKNQEILFESMGSVSVPTFVKDYNEAEKDFK